MASINVPKHLQANQQTGETKQKIAPQSSWIQEMEYDSTTFTLSVTTKTGATYQHFYVYPAQWQDMIKEPRIGSYYSKNIKGKRLSAKVIDKNTGKNTKEGK